MTLNVLVLASGRGSRLKPITETVPKPCISIGGKSLIARIIEPLSNQDLHIGKVFVNISHLAILIVDNLVNEGLASKVNFIFEPYPLGSARTLHYIHQQNVGDYLIIHGDLLLGSDSITKLLDVYHRFPNQNIIFYHKRLSLEARSFLILNELNQVTSFVEGSGSSSDYSISNSGIYLITSSYLTTLKLPPEGLSIPEVLIPQLIEKKLLSASPFPGSHRIAIETYEDLLKARRIYRTEKSLFTRE